MQLQYKLKNISNANIGSLTFSKGISGVQSVVFSSSTALCCMPLSLLSLEGGGGGEAGVEGVFGELNPLLMSSSGHSLLENMLP